MFDIKGLLERMRSRLASHDPAMPIAAWSMLPREARSRALLQLVQALQALRRNSKLALKERYRQLCQIDDEARLLSQTLLAAYQGREEVAGMPPRQALHILMALGLELAQAYRQCLKLCGGHLNPEFERMSLRATLYFAAQIKWASVRYFEVEPGVWRQLHRLYLGAEQAGFAHSPLQAYSDEPLCSIEAIYKQALLLALVEPARFHPDEIEQIEAYLQVCSYYCSLENVINPPAQAFAINLDEAGPPTKLRRNMVGEHYRYLATAALADFLQEQAALSNPPLAPNLLLKMNLQYSAEGVRRGRRNERRKFEQAVQVQTGLLRIGLTLRQQPDCPPWMVWTLLDESLNGVGANYKIERGMSCGVDELFLMQWRDRLSLNLVRRLYKTRDGMAKVGAEQIGLQPYPVTLMQEDGLAQYSAILCAESPLAIRLLVLPKGGFDEGGTRLLMAAGKRYTITLGPLLELLPEYVLSGFTVQSKPAV